MYAEQPTKVEHKVFIEVQEIQNCQDHNRVTLRAHFFAFYVLSFYSFDKIGC